jgi:hypothetical protein
MAYGFCNGCKKEKDLPRNTSKYCSRNCWKEHWKPYNFGQSSAMKGRKHNKETKQKMRIKKLGTSLSLEHKNNLKGRIPWNKGIIGINSGEKHYNWKGGITSENKLLRVSNRWKYWRKEVFKRDNYICQDCGKHNCELHPHHIVPVVECKILDYNELIFDIDNGQTLCKECHLTGNYHKGLRGII